MEQQKTTQNNKGAQSTASFPTTMDGELHSVLHNCNREIASLKYKMKPRDFQADDRRIDARSKRNVDSAPARVRRMEERHYAAL